MNSPILTNVRIIKRHNAAGVILGILAVLSIAVPVLLTIFPWFLFKINGDLGSYAADYTAIQLIIKLFNFANPTRELTHYAWEMSLLREAPLCYYLVLENIYAAAVWYILSVLMAIILFIHGIIFLIRGKTNHPHSVVVGLFLAFVCNLFLFVDSIRMGLYINYIGQKAAEVVGKNAPQVTFVIWPTIIIASVSLFFYIFGLFAWIIGLRKRYYQEDIEFVDIEPHPYEKNDGVQRNTLPTSITSVGGHAYAKNTALEIANIPSGIKELGIGAFSNCLRLKVVSIPKSVRRIGPNCFFNCAKLKRLNYGGSKEDWRRVVRGSNWLDRAGTTTVLCSDGPISVNPKH